MTLTPPFVTALTAGILVLMQMGLMLNVVAARRRNKQSLGDGGHDDVVRAVRKHGNLAENAAIFVVGAALLELTGGDRTAIALLCAGFVVGRIAHVIGLSLKKTHNTVRVIAVALTAFVCISLGVRLVLHAVRHLT